MLNDKVTCLRTARPSACGRCFNMIAAVAAVVFLAMTVTPAHAQAGDCCSANGTPGCDDPKCEALICGSDPFCCETEWDSLCASAADPKCDDCPGDVNGPPSQNGCCVANNSPGCDDAECEALICASDPFCCETQWDSLCADAANDQCEYCGGDCCTSHGTPGCDDASCQSLICASDSFCCSTGWDGLCANAANNLCAVCDDDDDPVDPGEKCVGDLNGDGTVGPMDLLELVALWGPCSGDCPADLNGDGIVNTFDLVILLQNWGDCPDDDSDEPSDNACCCANGTPGCENPDCEALICAWMPFCCDVEWDSICAFEASTVCPCESDCPPPSDCCSVNGSPGCDDPECESLVCAQDPFCCETNWDGLCADAANSLACEVCIPGW